MPDFTTHHIFGQQLYAKMPKERKRSIEAEPGAFCWGLQGPDLLFFHRAIKENSPLPDIGRLLHAEKTADLFGALLSDVIDHRKLVDFPILDAYFQGFICHYTLDRQVHPYVFYRQKEMEPPNPTDNRMHSKIESAIDRELYQLLYGQNIRSFPLAQYYKVSKEVRDTIGGIYGRIVKKVYGTAISPQMVAECFKDGLWVNRLLYDRSGMLKPVALLTQGFSKKGQQLTEHMKPGPLDGDFLNLQKRPWQNLNRPEKIENASVPEMMAMAESSTEAMQKTVYDAVRKGDSKGLTHLDFSRNFVDGKFR